MSITVKFVSGTSRRYDADTATLSDYDQLFVLSKWNPGERKFEPCETFDAGTVVMATLENGDIVLGKAKSK
jgi:hypothetical protein